MDKINNKDRVLEILIEKGCSDEEIAQVLNEVTKAGFSQLYSEAIMSFTNEDLKEVETAQSQEEANGIIARIYEERTGQDPSAMIQQFIDNFCEGFIREYEKEKRSQF